MPVALTIAGSDSGGEAGIQADLKTFAALGVFGTTAITCITAQSTKSVAGIFPLPARQVLRQMEMVLESFRVRAAKTGMLFSKEIIRAVAKCWDRRIPLIVDPVLAASSGRRLMEAGGLRTMTDELFPKAFLVTPNLPEAEVFLGRKIRSIDQLERAAADLACRFGTNFLVKGGHLAGKEAHDILHNGKTALVFSAPFVPGGACHGTGCTLSAAITASLAQGQPLAEAIKAAKSMISKAIEGRSTVSGVAVLSLPWDARGGAK